MAEELLQRIDHRGVAGQVVVDADHPVPGPSQSDDGVASEIPGRTGDQHCFTSYFQLVIARSIPSATSPSVTARTTNSRAEVWCGSRRPTANRPTPGEIRSCTGAGAVARSLQRQRENLAVHMVATLVVDSGCRFRAEDSNGGRSGRSMERRGTAHLVVGNRVSAEAQPLGPRTEAGSHHGTGQNGVARHQDLPVGRVESDESPSMVTEANGTVVAPSLGAEELVALRQRRRAYRKILKPAVDRVSGRVSPDPARASDRGGRPRRQVAAGSRGGVPAAAHRSRRRRVHDLQVPDHESRSANPPRCKRRLRWARSADNTQE